MSDYTLMQAWRAATSNCILTRHGFGQWIVQYPWRELNGPRTNTRGAPFDMARQMRTDLAVYLALELLGYAKETCDCATGRGQSGSGIDRLRKAVKGASAP